MSLEEQLAANTAALIALTAAIGAMQAPGPGATEVAYREITKDRSGGDKVKKAQAAIIEQEIADAKKPEPSSGTTSGEQSQPTGESSSPELDYAKDVKPITIRLSKEKGREITIGVLQKFDVQSAQQLAPGQWASYIATCEKVLAGGEV